MQILLIEDSPGDVMLVRMALENVRLDSARRRRTSNPYEA
jgi:hypothetical protein